MKRSLSFTLALLLTVALCVPSAPKAAAADSEALQAARQLYDLGLFKGVGTKADGTPDFDLDRAPTRADAVTMLVRIFGDEGRALAGYEEPASSGYYWGGEYYCPFTDVVDWAKPYVAYAYDYGLTDGRSETTFDSHSPVSAAEYLTLVLRAMGYESGVDFQWDRAWELTDQLGITDGRYNSDSFFTRGDVALVSLNALKQYNPLLLVRNAGEWYQTILTYPDDENWGWGGYLFTAIIPLRDVRIVEYNFQDDTIVSYMPAVGETMQYVGDLAPGEAIRVRLYLSELVAGWAIQFTDPEGRERAFSISESLRDGNILFKEIN